MAYGDRYGRGGGRDEHWGPEQNRGWQSRSDWDRGQEGGSRWRGSGGDDWNSGRREEMGWGSGGGMRRSGGGRGWSESGSGGEGRWSGGDDRWSGGQGHGGNDRGFMERAGEQVRSWFGSGEDRGGQERSWSGQDRSGGYQGSQRGGGSWFGSHDDRQDREGWFGTGGGNRGGEGMYGGGDGRGDQWGTGGGIGSADMGRGYGPGYDGSFGGPRFDRADAGSTGTHGVHPVASSFGANASYGASGIYGGGGGGHSGGRERAILEQARQQSGGQPQGRGMSPGMSGGMGGAAMGAGMGSMSRSDHDPHYSQWRQRQLDSFDRDYDEYRREHQSKFDQEFHGWREKRGQQRQSMSKVTEHMEVIGSDGQHLGTVDKVRGDKIILTKNDPEAGGRHHSIPCSWIESVDEKVHVNRSAEQAKREWQDVEREHEQMQQQRSGSDTYSRALFEQEREGSNGPHMLNRSFSDTYSDRDE